MLVYGKILQDFYDLQHDILRRSTHSLSTTTPLAIGVSFFSIVSLLKSNKIIKELKSTHCCRSVRGLETLSLGRTVCLQIRSLRRLIYRKLPAPQATSRLNDCPHCCKSICAVYTGFSALASLSDFVGCPKHQAESCWQIKY